VVYTSVDQPYAEPILAAFERDSGIRVRAVYDVEASKTTGLVNRLLAERASPQADVFWSSEVVQMILLEESGVLSPYSSPMAQDLPREYRDPEGDWTGFAARARVIIVNTDRVPAADFPTGLEDFLDPNRPGETLGIAFPFFGTTATHAAALYSLQGPEAALDFFEDLAARGVRVVDGNSVVRDLVASGELAYGLTDTDDACGALGRGEPVAVILPDQDTTGTLVIPSTLGLIAGGPNPEQGRALIDYLLRPETEDALVRAGYSHIPLHPGVLPAEGCIARDVVAMDVDYHDLYDSFSLSQDQLRALFLR
jgi:iron(III) transport system substrate-binding protein